MFGLEPDLSIKESECYVRGRKNYRCVECKMLIPRRISHWHISWLAWDATVFKNTWHSVRLCYGCRDDWEYLFRSTDIEYYSYGNLAEEIEEALSCGQIKPDDRLVTRWLPGLNKVPRPNLNDGQFELEFDENPTVH